MNLHEGNRLFRRQPEESAMRSVDNGRSFDQLIERSVPQVIRFVANHPEIVEVFLSRGFRDRILEAGSNQKTMAENIVNKEPYLFASLDLEGDALHAFMIALARNLNQ